MQNDNNNENKIYQKILYEKNDWKNKNNVTPINNIYEDSNYKLNNNQSQNNFISNSLKEQKYKMEPISARNFQLMSSYPNNKINNLDEYYYSYNPASQQKNEDLIISSNQISQININNEKKILSNILSSNTKNISSNSQISQEIDRQKLKFDEMVEKAKNLNNSENFYFDLKKYLPKENSFENSKALMKYKDLIKPKNLNKYNCMSTRNNNENKLQKENYEDIKNNSISEIPIQNEILFEEELSTSEFNFNIDSPIKNKVNKEGNLDNKKINEEEIQSKVKQNLLNNNIINRISQDSKNNKINSKNDLNKNDEHITSNLKDVGNLNDINYSNKTPFYNIYYQTITELNEQTNNNSDLDKNDLNEIEKTNLEFSKENNYKNINIQNFSWYCLDFEDNKEKIFDNFFNND